MKLIIATVALTILTTQPLAAQDDGNSPLKIQLETRGDYQREYVDGNVQDDNTGFKGKYLNVTLSGDITDDVRYVFRHRLNKMGNNSSFFDATDFLYAEWDATKRITLSAGKQVVAIGGFEYDRAPISLYFCSEFWNNIGCYQWGASVTYNIGNSNDKLLFQVCESPFRAFANNRETYAYNLMWMGSHGPINTLWSANMQEYDKGKYISYLSFGNEINISSKIKLQLDLLNRASNHNAFWFKDCSLIAELSYMPTKKLNVFAKTTYDVNKTDHTADYTVMPQTEIRRIGGGLEFMPLANDKLRLHANYCYTFGKNGNPEGVLNDKHAFFDVGLTWRVKWKVDREKE